MSETNDRLRAIRHSSAHIMAAAILKLWPKTKFGVGPVVDDGWYYDLDAGQTISEDDFAKIEAQMALIVAADLPFEQFDKPIGEAIKWAKANKQDFKLDLLNDLKRDGTTTAQDIDPKQLGVESDGSKVLTVSFYKCGEFTDMCRGPHVKSSGQVGAFKLHKIAGAYWRGDETKAQLQRLYGWGFKTKAELEKHAEIAAEARQRDHRKLGQQMDLFTFSDLVGSGLPLFTPRGSVLRELLGRYSQQLREDSGFKRVWTPHMTKTDLYKKSGHWDKFGSELFLVTSQETSDELVLKPMNCPHHVQIFASQQRSYRELPIRYMENTTDYRDEKSGELHGLSRVRSLTQDDSHVFCTEDQLEQEVGRLLKAAKTMYSELAIALKFRLSYRDDSDAYLGDSGLWQHS
ncbi:MAG TPA: threonine--tRNA ligase, partial [Candidatus Saccharimonadales bacterium]